jgi:hypothetical protein
MTAMWISRISKQTKHMSVVELMCFATFENHRTTRSNDRKKCMDRLIIPEFLLGLFVVSAPASLRDEECTA